MNGSEILCFFTRFRPVTVEGGDFVFFTRFRPVTAEGGDGGGAKLILRVAFIVRSLYFNLQPNRTIFTMSTFRTAKSPQ